MPGYFDLLPGGAFCTAACVLATLLVIRVMFPFDGRWWKLPPGPRGWPVVGCLPYLPSGSPHTVFAGWSKLYGPLISLRVGSSLVVVANDADTIRAVQSSRELAGRPDWITMKVTSAGGYDIVFGLEQNLHYMNHKKLLIRELGKRGMLEQIVLTEALALCQHLRDKVVPGQPFDCSPHMDFVQVNILYMLMFGKRYELSDVAVRHTVKIVGELSRSLSAGQVFNVFPWMRFIPGQHRTAWCLLRKRCQRLWNLMNDAFTEAVKATEGKSKDETLTDCFLNAATAEHLYCKTCPVSCLNYEDIIAGKEASTSSFSGSRIQGTLFDVLFGGYETMVVTMLWIIALLVRHPDIQQQIRDEINQEVEDVPTWSLKEESRLPLLEAFINETHRMYRTIPLPHCAVSDTTVCGYRIPKGTAVYLNFWALHNDETYWDDPDIFKPQRFLEKKGEELDRHFQPFSSGRRVCMGRQFAQMETFLLTALLVQNFKLESVVGKEPQLKPRFGGRALKPEDFSIVVFPC